MLHEGAEITMRDLKKQGKEQGREQGNDSDGKKGGNALRYLVLRM